MTALQQDTMRIRQELNLSKQMVKEAQQVAECNRLEAEAAKSKALAAEQVAERKATAVEQAAERKLTATVMNLLQEGFRIETISKCVGLPLEAIQKLAQQFGQGQTGLT